ncbi:glycine cleavage system T [Fusarium albosuccineum]|uniref:Glycine cleavage system T n=1 Tax=Fusarium albosuccineum TaxID=1237068 RepID=A0A8H4L903_9HYPO|nr:glycine cleavage system T [Fusarium albosuccineum]
MIPTDPSVNTWTRFITTFEASEFTDWIDESVSWKSTCYIGDWSPLLKIRVRGPDSKMFFEYLSTNYWPNFKPGQAKHAIFCRDNGTVMGEGVVMMLADDDFIFTSVPGVTWALYQFHRGSRRFNATVDIVTDEWYLFQVQGPKSVEVMEAATGSSVTDLKFMHAKIMTINGSKFWCLRQGVSGERGFELWGPADQGQMVYKAITASGASTSRILFEIEALTKQVEGAFPTPGLDFLPAVHGVDPELRRYHHYLQEAGLTAVSFLHMGATGNYSSQPSAHHRTPFDLGWGWLVNFDHDFIGKEALEAVAIDPPNALVALEWNSEDVTDVYASLFRDETFEYMELPRNGCNSVAGHSVYVNGCLVGCAVSGCYSYWFKRMISLSVIGKRYSLPGTEVIIGWGQSSGPQKSIRAIVKPAPYKEDQRKKPLKT